MHGRVSPPCDPEVVRELQCERDEARARAVELEERCRAVEAELAALKAGTSCV
jgi:hypothetical protein